MRRRRAGDWLVLAWLLVAGPTAADAHLGYCAADDGGSAHYCGRRDQVPERYRDQLPSDRTPEPIKAQASGPKPSVTGGRVGPPVSAECVLRVRGTEQRRGSSQSYPDCEACQKALKGMSGET